LCGLTTLLARLPVCRRVDSRFESRPRGHFADQQRCEQRRGSEERSQFRVLDEFEEEEESEGELYAEDEGAETEEEQIQVQQLSIFAAEKILNK
jgi:hypothetical protein